MTDDQLIITACNNWLKSHNRADYLTLAYESIEDLLVVLKTQKMDINVMRDTMQSMIAMIEKCEVVTRKGNALLPGIDSRKLSDVLIVRMVSQMIAAR